MEKLKLKTEHCAFVVLNSAGRCTANCHWNDLYRKYNMDCTGKSGKHDENVGHEVHIRGERYE